MDVVDRGSGMLRLRIHLVCLVIEGHGLALVATELRRRFSVDLILGLNGGVVRHHLERSAHPWMKVTEVRVGARCNIDLDQPVWGRPNKSGSRWARAIEDALVIQRSAVRTSAAEAEEHGWAEHDFGPPEPRAFPSVAVLSSG